MLGYPHPRRVPYEAYAEQAIGISTDEIGRARDSGLRFLRNVFPLLDLGFDRARCVEFLAERGFGQTVKSACVGCPFHGNAGWRWWQSGEPIYRLQGRTLGLLAFGAMGRPSRPGHTRSACLSSPTTRMWPEEVAAHGARPTSFGDLLGQADYLVVQAPFIEKNHHLIGESEFRRMKPTSIPVNTGRADQSLMTAPCTRRCGRAGSSAPAWTRSRRNQPNSGSGNR